MRTLLRMGRRAHLVRIEGGGAIRYLVGGPDLEDRRTFIDAEAADAWYLAVERGEAASPPRGPKRLLETLSGAGGWLFAGQLAPRP
ncbi:MAG: hypothetical protein JO127_09905 [Caulobacteraceae bacterium]|nr:hypothetical protein [Caulobacteraceae bacterium]